MWANNQFLKDHEIVKNVSMKIPLASHPGSSYLTLAALQLRWEQMSSSEVSGIRQY